MGPAGRDGGPKRGSSALARMKGTGPLAANWACSQKGHQSPQVWATRGPVSGCQRRDSGWRGLGQRKRGATSSLCRARVETSEESMEDRGGLHVYVCMYLGGTSLQFLPCQTLAQACAPCPPSLSLQDCTVSKSVPLDSGTGSVPPVSGVVLGHLVNLCVPQFPHL